jgi:predicted RNase H-like HicB family nuclease
MVRREQPGLLAYSDAIFDSQSIIKSDKSAADVYDHPIYRETNFKPAQINEPVMKKYRANFVVKKDEDGILCAADLEQGIFADGKTKEELMKDIREAVECHFEVSPEKVDVEVEIRITDLN